jgi:hypothetical protein
MWGALCSFQILLGIANAAFVRSETHRTHEHILLSVFGRLSQTGEPGSCIYVPQEQGSPVIPAGIMILPNQVQFQAILRPTFSRSFRPGVGHP